MYRVPLVISPGGVAHGLRNYLLSQYLAPPQELVFEPLSPKHHWDAYRAMKDSREQIAVGFPEWASDIATWDFQLAQEFLTRIAEEPLPNTVFAAYSEGTFRGLASTRPTNEEGAAQLLYWVAKGSEGKGFATQMACYLTGVGFDLPGIDRLQIQHNKDVPQSARIAKHLGYGLAQTLTEENGFPATVPSWFVWEKPNLGR